MFKTVRETVAFVTDLRAAVKDVVGVQIVVAPPFTAIHAAAEARARQQHRRLRAGSLLGARRRVHR